jgi:cell surface protein SprA
MVARGCWKFIITLRIETVYFFLKHLLFYRLTGGLRSVQMRIAPPSFSIPVVLWLIAIGMGVVALRTAPPESPPLLPLFSPDSTLESGTGQNEPGSSVLKLFPPDGREDTTDAFQFPPDSAAVQKGFGKFPDTTMAGDTTQIEVVDSTARVTHFLHRRHDPVFANGIALWASPFYLKYPTQYRREISLDSTGRIVTIRETVLDKDVKIPITMRLEEYIEERSKLELERRWQTLASDYRPAQEDEGLESVFGQFTNIDIPVPANPFLSIFGPPRINLRISGAVDIRAAFRNQKSDQQSVNIFDQVRNEPDFNQEVQINVNGTIGDKLNILADWNTQRVFEYENQLKIKYTGYEDEMVQSVEAGNVSFGNLPPLVGSSQALFGIKARFQAGPLFLTTLVSQKKGQTKEISVSGGSQTTTRNMRPTEYSRNHFFVDTLYRKFYDSLKVTRNPQYTQEMDFNRVKDIDVWVSITTGQQQYQARNAIAYIELPALDSARQRYPDTMRTAPPDPGRIESHQFIKLKPTEYIPHPYEGYVTINTSLTDQQIVAVSYRIEGATTSQSDDRYFGEFPIDDTSKLVLKLIKPSNLQPSYRRAWKMMLKNIYSVGGTGLREENFKVKIVREQEAGDPTEQILGSGRTLLDILGLDRFNANNQPQPDGNFDWFPGYDIDPARGEIIFPTLEPFRTNIRELIGTLQAPPADTANYIFHELYDTTVFAASNNTTKNKYYINVEYQAAQRSNYSLGFNLVEGSVKVLLNGNPMTPNVDYTVDYITGEVVIRNPAALVPGANLEIKYEQNDLFQLAAKTLIGARGEMSPLPNTNLGFTVMNLNKQTLSDKVRLGEEPSNNTIFGIDGSTSFNLPQVTDALNALPLFQTREMSTLRIGGEMAYMVPDPNTKKSPITGDRGEAIAYIDDFEGARRTLPLGVNYAIWSPSSPPVRFEGNQEIARSSDAKAKLSWYNPDRSQQPAVTEIWPNRSFRRGEELVGVLDLQFNPNRRGMYNYSRNADSTLHATGTLYDDPVERRNNWNGITRYLATTTTNLLEQNIGFLEIWMKVIGNPDDVKRGRLYVNFGAISEAVITSPADTLIRQYYAANKTDPSTGEPRLLTGQTPFSEDLVIYSNANGVLNQELGRTEDVGLDMLNDDEERDVFSWLANDQRYSGDPSGDNYSYSTGSLDFNSINGFQNNRLSPAGLFPNTEDLNNNFQRDLSNNYLEYEIPLDSVYIDSLGVEQTENPYIVGGGTNGWHQFRIPLTVPTRIVGRGAQSALDVLQNLQYARLFLSGFSDSVQVRIADISLVGNQWQAFVHTDSVLRVSVVNIEDNPNYSSPPGVIRERDRTQPDQQILANEQSLALILTNLPVDSMRQAIKNIPRALDVFNYRSMKMFVHGDPTFGYRSVDDYDASIFLRFGSDTSNFYEYRQPVIPGWDDMKINFAELTTIKTLRQTRGDSIHLISNPFPVVGKPSAEYRIRGNPALTNIKAMWVGIINTTSRTAIPHPLSGEVWINELRLIGVDDQSGYAYRFDTQMKLADLGDVSFNFSKTDPHFHGLEDRFGTRLSTQNWGLGVNLGLDKLFPTTWQGTSLPFNYSHTENFSRPRYLPSTDVEVEEAASRASTVEAADSLRIAAQTLRVTETYAVPNLRIGLPSQAWYIRDIVNRISWSFNYTTSRERSPVTEQRRAWQWSGRVGYSVTLPTDYYIEPFSSLFDGVWFLDDFKKLKLYYVPVNFSTGLSVNRSRAYERARGIAGERPVARSFTASRSVGFGYKLTEGGLSNISGDYSLNIESNLAHLETDQFGFQRPFSSILSDIFFRDRFIYFGKDGRYGQRFTANSRPKFPQSFGVDKYLDLTLGYSVNYSWQNNFQQGDLGKGAAWENNISTSMNLRLKSLTDPWFAFADAGAAKPSPQEESRRRRSVEDVPKDTTVQDTTKRDEKQVEPEGPSRTVLDNLKTISKILIKIPFLEYETVNITYAQTNRVVSPGVVGGPGFLNFWGKVPFFQDQVLEDGPTRLYQLGLISDPSGRLRVSTSSRFPFVRFDVTRGLRAAGAQMTDQFGQTHRLGLRTSRALWEGAQIELNWNVNWSYSKNTTIRTDTLGVPSISSEVTQGSIERSFFTVPPVFLFKALKSDLTEVGKKYNVAKRNSADTRSDDVKLSEAFESGLETLPFFKKIFGPYFPRVNYTFRWDGLERLSFLSGFVERMGLEHGYTSSYTRQWRGDPDGGQRTDAARVTYGFSPLLGLNGSMKDFLKGGLTSSLRYTTTTSYDLNVIAHNIAETFSQEIALTLTYSRRGFEFFLFGLSLSNDLEMGLTYSLTKNSSRTYDVNTLETNTTGQPLQGSTRTTLEPRIRYVLSSRVTASIFYRYTKIAPDRAGSFIPGSTTNEAGLDIHIAIQ